MGGDIAWGGAWIFIAWYAYLYSGEPGILKENFESMLRYLDYLEKCHPDYFADNARYKDWLGLENTPGAIVENAWWHEAAVLVAKAAGALGRKEEQLRLETVAKKIAAEFHRRLFNAEKGYYGSGSQTSNVLPLYFGMVPNELRQSVFEKLVENIESRGRHLSTGITATKQLLELLCQFGREDLAFAIATTEDFPGWGYMKKHGATAIWEHWEHLTGMGMNSHDHPALANIASWLTKCLAGIRPDPENPSFGNIIIAPCFPDGLDWAKAELEISQGKIRSSWKREGKSIFLQLKIPGNCAAVLRINRHFKLLGSQKNVVNREKTPNGISGIHLKSGSFKLKIDA
jgi:alpha-L-rhamnosidase